MGLLIELAPAVEEALSREAGREGVSPSTLAARIVSAVALNDRSDMETSVRTFPEGLKPVADDRESGNGTLPPTHSRSSDDGRTQRVSVYGKYAHWGVSSYDLMREKQEEIEREERKFSR